MGDIEVEGNKFYLEIIQNGELKLGTIVSQDLFKAFLKIKDQLQYDLQYIYSQKDTSKEEKEKSMNNTGFISIPIKNKFKKKKK